MGIYKNGEDGKLEEFLFSLADANSFSLPIHRSEEYMKRILFLLFRQ